MLLDIGSQTYPAQRIQLDLPTTTANSIAVIAWSVTPATGARCHLPRRAACTRNIAGLAGFLLLMASAQMKTRVRCTRTRGRASRLWTRQ